MLPASFCLHYSKHPAIICLWVTGESKKNAVVLCCTLSCFFVFVFFFCPVSLTHALSHYQHYPCPTVSVVSYLNWTDISTNSNSHSPSWQPVTFIFSQRGRGGGRGANWISPLPLCAGDASCKIRLPASLTFTLSLSDPEKQPQHDGEMQECRHT